MSSQHYQIIKRQATDWREIFKIFDKKDISRKKER